MTEPDDQTWTVYIIQAESGKLYTGITIDLERRLTEHKTGVRGAKFFRTSSPRRVLFNESRKGRSEAMRREREIKGMSRVEKLELIRRQTKE